MPRKKKTEHQNNENSVKTPKSGEILQNENVNLYDDGLSFTPIQHTEELICLPGHTLQYFIRKNGKIVDRGSLNEHNSIFISSGYELAFIPRNAGNVQSLNESTHTTSSHHKKKGKI